MQLYDKTVLVTGADGFIGSHLVEALVGRCQRVRVLKHYHSYPQEDNLVFIDPDVRARIETVAGDVQDPHQMQDVVRDVDVVFHLAALIGIPYSYEAPASYLRTNVLGTHHLLEGARRAGIVRFVHTSTSEVYGTAQYSPIDEDHPLVGQSPYSASKIAADKIAESYYLAFELPVVTVRPFNTFGPRQSERAVIPTIISQLLFTEGLLKLGDLSPRRDFTFVGDTVAGFIRAGESEQALGQTINLGTGQAVTIGDLALLLMQLVGRKTDIVSDTPRLRPEKSEVQELICNNRRAAELLNWKPTCSLPQGLKQAIEFIKAHPQRYRPRVFQR